MSEDGWRASKESSIASDKIDASKPEMSFLKILQLRSYRGRVWWREIMGQLTRLA
jgi:hypothetical protein